MTCQHPDDDRVTISLCWDLCTLCMDEVPALWLATEPEAAMVAERSAREVRADAGRETVGWLAVWLGLGFASAALSAWHFDVTGWIITALTVGVAWVMWDSLSNYKAVGHELQGIVLGRALAKETPPKE